MQLRIYRDKCIICGSKSTDVYLAVPVCDIHKTNTKDIVEKIIATDPPYSIEYLDSDATDSGDFERLLHKSLL